jgi:hypothetical protein
MIPDDHSESESMQTFVVECYWPGMIEEDARNILDQVMQLGGEASPGRSLWSLGCVLMPADGMALFLLTAPSEGPSAPPAEQGVRAGGRDGRI